MTRHKQDAMTIHRTPLYHNRPAHVSTCSAAPAHRWIIETPDGPTVASRCKHCGMERVYATAGEYERGHVWND